jgi:hypothetical protein
VSLTPVTNLPPLSLKPVATLPQVSTTPVLLIMVVHLELQNLQDFSKVIEMPLILFSGIWGKMIHEKNLKQKNS